MIRADIASAARSALYEHNVGSDRPGAQEWIANAIALRVDALLTLRIGEAVMALLFPEEK